MGSSGGSSGGGAPNAVKVRKFPFAYNTPGILTGAALYTPTADDVLLDAWFQITTAWNGTTPLGDFGIFDVNHSGWLKTGSGLNPVDMTVAYDDTGMFGPLGLWIGGPSSLTAAEIVNLMNNSLLATGVSSPFAVGVTATALGQLDVALVPAQIAAATPFKICVSQSGATNGADPGATQGAAVLYLVTATPA